jgi:chemotaxis protein MotA
MKVIIGLIVGIGCVLAGYVLHHGKLAVLYQPTEYLIIGGAGVGAYIITNKGKVIIGALKSIKYLLKGGHPVSKKAYIELLLFQYEIFKFIKTKGMLEVEAHVEKPQESDIFKKYPSILSDHHATDFICDYIRVMTMGLDDKYQLEDMMDMELEVHHQDKHEIAHSVVLMGDAFPALGIVAAVLGVIITMGSIAEPPEILGGLVGAALVGTFLGIFLCYGVVGPMGAYLTSLFEEEHQYFLAMKAGILAHVQGNAPAVSVEFARKVIPEAVRPSFSELEQELQKL